MSSQEDKSNVIQEVLSGDALGVTAAAALIPAYRRVTSNSRGHSCPQTIWGWITKGYKLSDGTIVKLEACRVANRWITSRAAVARFITTMTEASQPSSETLPSQPIRQSAKRRRSAAAKAWLEAEGY